MHGYGIVQEGGWGGAVMGECYDSYLGEGDKFDMSGMPQREREREERFYTQP
jgi:hypothetical protein